MRLRTYIFFISMCVVKSMSSHANQAIDHLKHISKYKVHKASIEEIAEGNYDSFFPKKVGRSKYIHGSISKLNEYYYTLRDSSESYDPGLLYPNSPIFSVIEDDKYYIVTKVNRPAAIIVTRVQGIKLPKKPTNQGFFKIDKFSDFKKFQKDFIISLAETKAIHHSWINEDIEVSGHIDSDEWLISRDHVHHRNKRLRYSIEWEPVVDRKTGDIYVEYNLYSKK